VLLIGAVVYLCAAPRVLMYGRVMRRGIIGSCQSAATSKTVNALLVTSLTHGSSGIAMCPTFTFIVALKLTRLGLMSVGHRTNNRPTCNNQNKTSDKGLKSDG